MNILITGGAGFVGSNLAKKLLDQGNNIYVLDNYFTGKTENKHEGVVYFHGETRDIIKIFCNSERKSVDFDLIYHLGEYSRVEQSFYDIDLVFQYNWLSIYEVLKFVKIKGAKIVYAGSSTKFGDDGDTKYSSPYAFTKHTNTELIKAYCEWFNIDYAITYFYNVYGDNEISSGEYSTVIAKFLHEIKILDAKELHVVKPGTQRRNFTHIKDIVNGLVLVGKSGKGDNYGIGSQESYSIIEIAEMMKMPIKFIPERKGNRMQAPIIAEKTKMLGWKQEYKLADYVKEKLI